MKRTRRAPDPNNETARALLIRSGNRCAFPRCRHPLVNHKNQFIGQLCHIAAAAPGGERFDSDMEADDRRSYDNLMLLCYAHHVETDDVELFPVERMRQMKWDHERRMAHRAFSPPDDAVSSLEDELFEFRGAVADAECENIAGDLSWEVGKYSGVLELFDRLDELVQMLAGLGDRWFEDWARRTSIVDDLDALAEAWSAGRISEADRKAMGNGDWEGVHIDHPNTVSELGIRLMELQVLVLMTSGIADLSDPRTAIRLRTLRARLLEVASNGGRAD